MMTEFLGLKSLLWLSKTAEKNVNEGHSAKMLSQCSAEEAAAQS